MLKRLISLMTMLFIFQAAALSQNTARKVVYLNANIDRTYAGYNSTAIIGYPPVSDVYVMHAGTVNNSAHYIIAETPVIYTHPVIYSGTQSYAGTVMPYHVYYSPRGSFYYSVVPAYRVVSSDPYYKYMNMHQYYEEASLARADVSVTNSSVVKYRNYVRPSERTKYTEVNYLTPAPVVTSRPNIIVQPHGVVYNTAKTEQLPIRDFRTEIWNYKDYTNTAENHVNYYTTLEFAGE